MDEKTEDRTRLEAYEAALELQKPALDPNEAALDPKVADRTASTTATAFDAQPAETLEA